MAFKGYHKVDVPEKQEPLRKKTINLVSILSISLLLLVGLLVGVFSGKNVVHNKKIYNSGKLQVTLHVASTIRSMCGHTLYPDFCFNTLNSSKTSDPLTIVHLSLVLALESLEKTSTVPEEYTNRMDKKLVQEALNVCGIVLNEAIDSLNEALDTFNEDTLDELRTSLSGVITDHETCFDALEETKATSVEEIRSLMQNSTQLVSNTLAIVSSMMSSRGTLVNRNRRLLAMEELDFPNWVGDKERLLLQTKRPKPDWTVATDGSGNFTTIKEALDKIRKKNNVTQVIYVKAGTYFEYINLTSSYWNVMIYGDGKENTTISWHAHANETKTYFTPTFAVSARGFIAQDIGFINTAGANANQCVAFRSSSDKSIFHRCSFDSFQDTLYVHKGDQFYLECTITGSVDFIFGNAAAVFQKCTILARNPRNNKNNIVTITAQSKSDPGQNTGISIQRCNISKLDDLPDSKTYLGRPWKNYSTIVIMDTYIGGFVNPKGWVAWNSTFDPPPVSIFYAEYDNIGDGSNTMGRVKWAGYTPNLTEAEALKYHNHSFINGRSWLMPFIAHGHGL